MSVSQYQNSIPYFAVPEILKGEAITGYLYRLKYASPNASNTFMNKHLGKHRQSALPWIFPNNLKKISEIFGDTLPEAKELIKKHTMYSLYSPFLPAERLERIYKYFHDGEGKGIPSLTGMNTRSGASRGQLTCCFQCIKEDKNTFCTSFWRVAHMVPGLAVCAIHKEPLFKACTTCIYELSKTKKLFIPSYKCLCGGKLSMVRKVPGSRDYEGEILIATTAEKFLNTDLSNVYQSATFSHHLSIKTGLSNITRRQRATELKNILLQHFTDENLNAYGVRFSSYSTLVQCWQGKREIADPILNILLVIAIYGSFEKFKNSLIVAPKDGNDAVQKDKLYNAKMVRYHNYWRSLTQSELELKRKEYREKVITLKNKLFHANRKKVASSGGTLAIRFLRTHDKDWLDKNLPLVRKRAIDSSAIKYRDFQIRNSDADLSAHIYKRYQLFKNNPVAQRCSARWLLMGHSKESYGRKKLDRYKLTRQALNDCEEKQCDWQFRCIEYLCSQVDAISRDRGEAFRARYTPFNSTAEYTNARKRIQEWLSKHIG